MVGRDEELAAINKLLKSNKAELLVVTGRRRVGKTYFIEQAFHENLTFQFIGTQDGKLDNQLDKFIVNLIKYFPKINNNIYFNNWAEALNYLSTCIDGLRKSKKKRVLFFDEFPWIDSHKSVFLQEFGYWWNSWAVKQNIIVAISGSATSYMITKVINDAGGLYNRVTKHFTLQPFTLNETMLFLKMKGIEYDKYHVIQLYMAMGGIPHYLEDIERGESASQSINRMCFKSTGLLKNEFHNLYKALFKGYENHVEVVRALSSKWKGLTRQEIVRYAKISDGGGLSKILLELESCSFILKQETLGKKSKDAIYRLIDEFTLFYFNFMEGNKSSAKDTWLQLSKLPKYASWQGYAFENLCYRHIEALKQALGISGIYSENASFTYKGDKVKNGFQIDMIIDRADNVINICEMKFYNKEFTLDKSYADKLRVRRATFKELSNTKKLVLNTLVTTYGLYSNEHSLSQVDNVVLIDKLFDLKIF